MSAIGTLVVVGLIGVGAGVGGTLWATRDKPGESAVEAVQASADVVEATGEASVGVVVAATAEETTDAETRQAVATSEPAPIAVSAAVEVLSPRSVGALAGYLGCIAGSQGKGEGSAAYGCVERGRSLDAALAAEFPVVVCTGEDCPQASE